MRGLQMLPLVLNRHCINAEVGYHFPHCTHVDYWPPTNKCSATECIRKHFQVIISDPRRVSLSTLRRSQITPTRQTFIMQSFVYFANPCRVVFGPGSLQKLPEELKRLNIQSPLVLSTPQQTGQAEDLRRLLAPHVSHVAVYTNATMHTPTHITDEAVNFASSEKVDGVVSIGGGSTTGLGKAISIRSGLPHVCVPTTYAGSEMTPILGETADGRKTTRSDPKILPTTVIYDVDLTMTLPTSMSAVSGVNAIAHAGKKNALT